MKLKVYLFAYLMVEVLQIHEVVRAVVLQCNICGRD